MSKIPLAERNERLAGKKVKRQLTDSPKSSQWGLMVEEGKRHVDDHTLDNAFPPKIQKQWEGSYEVLKNRQMTITKEGKTEGEPLPAKDGFCHHPSLWSDPLFDTMKFTGDRLLFLEDFPIWLPFITYRLVNYRAWQKVTY